MRIVIANVQVPFVYGGAEALALSTCSALREAGHQVEIVSIPFRWYPPEKILDHLLACRLLDVSESCGERVDLMVGLKFPAYCLPHPRKRLWVLHEHRTAYSLWDHPIGDLKDQPNGQLVRSAIEEADRQCLGEAEAVFALSRNVAGRLAKFHGITSPPLYLPPPGAQRFRPGGDGGYFYFPSRLCRPKRQWLLVEALARTSHPVELRFSGAPETAAYGRELAERAEHLGVASRVRWLGMVSEEEKVLLYSEALGVVFTPLDEDYGYITLEAMLSAKPVITCSDSGGPSEFVVDGETGSICDPTPEAIAQAMDELWADRARARRLGQAGLEHYRAMDITWQNVVDKLCSPV